jgi:hypothetical protein
LVFERRSFCEAAPHVKHFVVLGICFSSVVPLDREMLLKLLFALLHSEHRSPAPLGMRWRVALN